MIYTYKFADGTTNESEVSDKMAAELKELDRIEYNNNQAETRHHASLEAFNLDDGLFASDVDIEAEIETAENVNALHVAIKKLTPSQQELVKAIYFQEVAVNDYAELQNVDHSAISHRLKTIQKNLKKFLITPSHFASAMTYL